MQMNPENYLIISENVNIAIYPQNDEQLTRTYM